MTGRILDATAGVLRRMPIPAAHDLADTCAWLAVLTRVTP